MGSRHEPRRPTSTPSGGSPRTSTGRQTSCAAHDPSAEVLGVEEAFRVPLIDPETGEVLNRDLVGTRDRLEKDSEGRVVVVDLKTAARKYGDLQVDASLQLSVYSYATAMDPSGSNSTLAPLGALCPCALDGPVVGA